MGIDVRDPDQPVGTLSGGERQAVAIARAVYFGAKVLILDEPTSALGVKQSGVVLRYVAQARDRGLGVIFITHNPHHAFPVGDRFVILNRGQAPRHLEQGRDHPRRADQDDVGRRGARRADPRDRTGPRVGDGVTIAPVTSAAPAATGAARRRIGVGLIGFGWLGQAHSRSMLRIPTLFDERAFDPELVVCSDTVRGARRRGGRLVRLRPRGDRLARGHGRRGGRRRLRHRAEHAAPRAHRGRRAGRQARLLREARGRHARADRPRRAGGAARRSDHGRGLQLPLGAARALRARSSSPTGAWARSPTTAGASSRCTAATRSALLSWRFLVDEGGYGVTSDLLSHAVDLAHMLLGPITRVVGTTATFIAERPLALPGQATTGAARPRTRAARSPTRTTRACCASSPRARAGPSRPAARSSGPRARTRSTSTAPRARWAGTSSSSTSSRSTWPRTSCTPAIARSSAATASPTTAPSCRAARTASASRTSSPSRTSSSAARSPRAGPSRRASPRRSTGSRCRRRCCARRSRGAGKTSSPLREQ